MKKLLTLVALIIIALWITTIVEKDNIANIQSLEQALLKYKKLLIKEDFSGLIGYIYPPILEEMSKKMLIKKFKIRNKYGKMLKIEAFIYSFEKPLKQFDKGLYTTVNYTLKMQLNIVDSLSKKTYNSMQKMMLGKQKKLYKAFILKKLLGNLNDEAYNKIKKALSNPQKPYKEFILEMAAIYMGKDAKFHFDGQSIMIELATTGIVINEENKGWKFVESISSSLSKTKLKSLLPKKIVENEKEIFDEKY